jgi:hypothetical protein
MRSRFASLLLAMAVGLAACTNDVAGTDELGSSDAAAKADNVLLLHFDTHDGSPYVDMSGNANNASCVVGTACPVQSIGLSGYQHLGHAIELDGKTQCLTLGQPATLAFGREPFSMGMWILPRALPSAANTTMAVFSKYSSRHSREFSLDLFWDGSAVRVRFVKTQTGGSPMDTILSNRTLTAADLNRWMFVGMSTDGAGTFDLYAQPGDGALAVDKHVTGVRTAVYAGGAEVRVGCQHAPEAGSTGYFTGKIDEVVVYASASSLADLTKLYVQSDPAVPAFGSIDLPPRDGTTATQEGRIDQPELGAILADLHLAFYQYVIDRHSSDFTDLPTTLAANPAQTFRLGLPAFKSAQSPDDVDHVKWAADLATIAAAHANVSALNFDDFMSLKTNPDASVDSYLNFASPANSARTICGAAHAIAPAVKFTAVLYCGAAGLSGVSRYEAADGLPAGTLADGTAETSAFVALLAAEASTPLAAGQEHLSSCLAGVELYPTPGTSAATINGCIATLRPLGKEIIEGIYVSELSSQTGSPPTLAYYQHDIAIAQQTNPDGFMYWNLPDVDPVTGVAPPKQDPASLRGALPLFASLETAVTKAAQFIAW